MSKISLSSNILGTGTLTIASPNTDTDRTLTLPDNSGTLLSNASTAGFPAGSVLQVVQGSTTTSNSTTSQDVPIDGASLVITPTSASSKILIIGAQNVGIAGASTTDQQANVQLMRDSTRIWGVVGAFDDIRINDVISWAQRTPVLYLDSPATTSAVTYKIQVSRRAGSGTLLAQYSNNISTIIAMEIAA